ncbi:type II toxin-antitoxin system Phd/YefM family antitoxin [Inquilinus sp. NPDC058860]|uniref:type II toxin-antitoxin system Phd/YefM family antitoxin n=1 Tax=Inquilinus sp. NPDC058860 TaxID=3346652 RepID=UPI003694B94E
MSWRLRDARDRFSELVEKALTEGPQRVTRRGKPAVVVISEAEYRKLIKPGRSFVDHLLAAPKVDIEIERVNVPLRDVDL